MENNKQNKSHNIHKPKYLFSKRRDLKKKITRREIFKFTNKLAELQYGNRTNTIETHNTHTDNVKEQLHMESAYIQMSKPKLRIEQTIL